MFAPLTVAAPHSTARRPGAARLTVAVLARHRTVRESLERVLRNEPTLVVVGSAPGAVPGGDHPDVVVAELSDWDDVPADRVLPELRAAAGRADVVLLVEADRRDIAEPAAALGMSVVAVEDGTAADLVAAIRTAASGNVIPLPVRVAPAEAAFDPAALNANDPRPSSVPGSPELTVREREVLEALARDPSTAHAAARLAISGHTLKTHVKRILPKLGVHSRVEAVATALRHGIISAAGL
jgi:DNA-binding NarL/FixJ family response regulator